MTQDIVEVDPPRRWAARGLAARIRPDARVLVEPLGDGVETEGDEVLAEDAQARRQSWGRFWGWTRSISVKVELLVEVVS